MTREGLHGRETMNVRDGRAYSVEDIALRRFAAIPWMERAPDPALPSGSWLSVEEAFVLQQAHDVLVKRDPRDLRELSMNVIKRLGDPRRLVGVEPAVVLAVAVELARRWRARAGVAEERRAASQKLDDTRPTGHVSVAEARGLATARGVAPHVFDEAVTGGHVPYHQAKKRGHRWIPRAALEAWIEKVRS